jgi:hypothetical protein
MDNEYEIICEEHPGESSAWGIIGEGINEYNTQKAGDQNAKILCYTIQGPDRASRGQRHAGPQAAGWRCLLDSASQSGGIQAVYARYAELNIVYLNAVSER